MIYEEYYDEDYVEDEYLGAINTHSFCLDYLPNTFTSNTRHEFAEMPLLDENHAGYFNDICENQSFFSKLPPSLTSENTFINSHLESPKTLLSSILTPKVNESSQKHSLTSIPTRSTCRTIEELRKHKIVKYPEDLATGPWDSPSSSKMELNEWALSIRTGGGRFNLIWASTYQPTSKKGIQKTLSCYRARKSTILGEIRNTISQKCNCPFNIRIEQCVEGWVVASGNFQHNHDLVLSEGASLAEASLRQIPDEFHKLGFELKRAGLSISKINQVFISKAHEQKLEITWTYQDVFNRFQPSPENRAFDATNFVDYLQRRYTTNNLLFRVQTDEDSSINIVLWMLTDSLERWAELDRKNPLLFDTSHGTNKYALKFAAFTTVDKYGNSQILACTLMTRETIDSFVWIFTEFLQGFIRPQM